MSEALGLLARLVAIPSVSGGEGEVADAVAAHAAGLGVAVQRSGHNCWFELGGGGPRLLLHSHVDTVPPCAGWSGDPWQPRIADGRLTGLGANDAKGCVAAILSAAGALAAAGWQGPGTLVVALTAEEETGGPGGIRSVLPLLAPLDAAVFGEPTGLAPCTAQGGMLLVKARARGQSGHVAHAARLGLPNAIHLAAEGIARLAAHRFPEYSAPDGSAQRTQAQVTLVSGGISANQVPDLCEFQLDLRTTPETEHAALLDELQRLLGCELECLSRRYEPVATAADEPIVRAALAATGRAAYYSPTVSDWSLAPGIPAVKLGPGESPRSHRPDEFILESELLAGADCYARLVRRYFEEAAHG